MEQMLGVSAPQGVTNTQPPAPVPGGMALPVDPMMAAMGMAAPPQEQPKGKSMIPTEIARLLAEAINSAKLQAAEGLTEYLGDPRGSVSVKDADLVRVWRKRNPDIDPLYEKFVNKLSDEEIMYAMYPMRRALIRYGRRTYTEQVEFAEKMARLNLDPRFDDLDAEIDDEDEDTYIPPQSAFPSKGEEEDIVPAMEDEETEE